MKTKTLNSVVCLALAGWVVLAFACTTEAQTNNSAPAEVEPYPCEYNISTLSAAHHAAGENGLVIVIARLGDGEHTKMLNRRRLHNARVYLTEFDWRRGPETVITAEGESVKGYGRLELYVQGKLFRVLLHCTNSPGTWHHSPTWGGHGGPPLQSWRRFYLRRFTTNFRPVPFSRSSSFFVCERLSLRWFWRRLSPGRTFAGGSPERCRHPGAHGRRSCNDRD